MTVTGLGLLHLPQLLAGGAEVVQGIGEVRLDLQGLAELHHGFLILLLPLEDDPQQVMQGRLPWIGPQQLAGVGAGRLQLAAARQAHHPLEILPRELAFTLVLQLLQRLARLLVLRVAGDDLAVELLGLLGLALFDHLPGPIQLEVGAEIALRHDVLDVLREKPLL